MKHSRGVDQRRACVWGWGLVGLVAMTVGCSRFSGLHDLAGDPATVTGHIGAGFAVALVAEDGAIVGRGLADPQGAFVLRAERPGRVTLVANNLAGRGTVRELALWGGADFDVGTLGSLPLESFPPLFELRGLGYEERVSRDDGDHREARYTHDSAYAYTLRARPHATTVDLVETRTRDGVVRVLRSGETVGGLHTFGEDARPALFDDRYHVMLFERPSGPAGESLETWVVQDLAHGRELLVPRSSGTHYSEPGARPIPFLRDGPFYSAASGGEDAHLVYSLGVGQILLGQGAQPVEVLELCGLSLTEGASSRRCVRAPGATTRIEWRESRAQVVSQGAVYRVDLTAERPEFEHRSLLGHSADDALWRAGGTLFALRGPDFSLLAMGDDEGAGLLEVARVDDGRFVRRLAVDETFRYALTEVRATAGADFTHWTDLAEGGLTALPTTLPLGGEAAPVRSWCRYDGAYRSARRVGGDDRATCFDAEHPGQLLARVNASTALCARLGGPSCDRFGLSVRYDPKSGAVAVAPEGQRVRSLSGAAAEVVTDPATGHRQVAWADAETSPRQATFLSADHLDLAWSTEGGALLYLTRDPVRGYVGLFRLDVTALRGWFAAVAAAAPHAKGRAR